MRAAVITARLEPRGLGDAVNADRIEGRFFIERAGFTRRTQAKNMRRGRIKKPGLHRLHPDRFEKMDQPVHMDRDAARPKLSLARPRLFGTVVICREIINFRGLEPLHQRLDRTRVIERDRHGDCAVRLRDTAARHTRHTTILFTQKVRQQRAILPAGTNDDRVSLQPTTSMTGSGNSILPPPRMYCASRSMRFFLKCHGSTRK